MAGRRTLASEVSAVGVALHAGVAARMTMGPVAAGTGIVFRRTDFGDGAFIPARWDAVADTRLGTVLKVESGASVAVVEHVLAALSGAAIDDCLIELDGPEPPAMDGDALAFLRLVDAAGQREQAGPRELIRVARLVEVHSQAGSARLMPCARAELYCDIDFPTAAIGRQSLEIVFTPETFRREIAPARTFGFLADAERLRTAGFGRGASLDNTLVIDKDRLMNPEVQRFADEFVRHKLLDAVGDLKLAGAPLLARYEGHRPSHALNNTLLRALFADSGNYERLVER